MAKRLSAELPSCWIIVAIAFSLTARALENIEYFMENIETIDEPEVDQYLKTWGVDQATAPRDTQSGQHPGNERLTQLMDSCSFLSHCRNDVATLPEPEWYQMTCVLAGQYGGPALIHQLSYPSSP